MPANNGLLGFQKPGEKFGKRRVAESTRLSRDQGTKPLFESEFFSRYFFFFH